MLDKFFGIKSKIPKGSLYSDEFIKTFAEEICCHVYCDRGDITGDDWERIFANCIGISWEKTNKFNDLADYNKSIAWSAKTVSVNLNKKINSIELISGRIVVDLKNKTSQEIGDAVLNTWNERVENVKKEFKKFYTIVLLRSNNLSQHKIFHYETEVYDDKKYKWDWSDNDTLYGTYIDGKKHFVWQPSGTQFRIIKLIPNDQINVNLNLPKKLTKLEILNKIQFNNETYVINHG